MIKTRHSRYIDPFTDYAFKRLFGQHQNKKILISFLNALLQGKKVIKDVIYLDKEQLGLSTQDRKSIFDIYCEDENGDRFVIEIQRQSLLYFSNRAVYYAAIPIIEQGVKGVWNHQLKGIYHIWILDHILDYTCPEKRIHEIKLTDTQTGKVFDNSLTYLLVEAPKFIQNEDELKTPLDQWMYVLNHLTEFQEIPLTLKDDPVFKDFFMLAELLNMNSQQRGLYLASLKEKWDEYSLRETGFTEGDKKATIKIATELKKLGIDFNIISKSTQLSIAQIESL